MPWPNGSGVRFPPWVLKVAPIVGALLFVGWTARGLLEELRTANTRLCRLERAAAIEPWESCHLSRDGLTAQVRP